MENAQTGSGENPSQGSSSLGFFRILGGIIGLGMIGFGMFWTVRLFFMIARCSIDPESMQLIFSRWEKFLAVERIITLFGSQVPRPLIVLMILGCAGVLLLFVSVRLAVAGTRLLSAAITDLSEIKKMIKRMRAGTPQ